MYEMDEKSKTLTIIGLILEGVATIGRFYVYFLLSNFEDILGNNSEFSFFSDAEHAQITSFINQITNIIGIIAIIFAVIFVISLVLFTKLLSGKFTEEQAKKVYLYQAVWGGFNIILNLITGILYLISGVEGYNGHHEEKDIRNGI